MKEYFLQCSIKKKKYEEQNENETKLKYFPIVKGKTFAVFPNVFPIANIRTRTKMWPTLD